MTAWTQWLLDLFAQNPGLAYAIIFAVAMGEALFVIGLFFPSTVVLVGAGTLVGLGKLKFWPIFLLTVLGAIAGDALSYWFGHIYKDKMRSMWPFSKYPAAIERGADYFKKHGGKSVFIGRFVPGVKAIVPGIAGMMGMDAWRFTVINIVSALAWAAVHLLPAIGAGVALTILGTMSKRMIVVVIIILSILVVALWVAKLVVDRIPPTFDQFLFGLHKWLHARNGKLAKWLARVTDPSVPQTTSNIALLGLLLALIPSFLVIASEIGVNEPLTLSDVAISHFIMNLRTDLVDRWMTVVTMLGDAQVALPVALAAFLALAYRKAWAQLTAFALAMAFAEIFVQLMKITMQRVRPINLHTVASSFSFPSGHATMSAVLYGVLAYLVAQDLPKWGKRTTNGIAITLILLVGFSRIYLGVHWPSDVVGGLIFGASIVAIFVVFLGGSSNKNYSLKGN